MDIVRHLLKIYFQIIIIFFLGRLILFVLCFDRFSDTGVNYWLSFLYGLRMDTIVASGFLIIPLLLFTLTPQIAEKRTGFVLKGYVLMVLSLCLFIEYATFPFFSEYDVRPNFLFVEYLVYPKEVINMIIGDYKLLLLSGCLLITGFIIAYIKYIKCNVGRVYQKGLTRRILWFLPLGIVIFIGVRSSFGHRPANLSDAMYSTNRVVNEITKNSIYSIGYAIYSDKKHETNISDLYGKMEITEAVSRFKTTLNIQSSNNTSPLRRNEKTHFKTDRPKNLVIFLQESMGHKYVGVLGGKKGITPNFDKLSQEGLFFANAFSNGTRSVRGIAGCVSGNFSVPGKGVVKRNKAQKDYFTISALLEPFGYHTMFLYGGESRFDNMRGWFLGNGFDQVIDEPEFKNPGFKGTWGVSDEDLVERANTEFINLYKKNKRFAAVLFSTSNHTPFDFPECKIQLVDGVPEKSVENAIKFADFAMGKFIEKAKKEPYFKDTIFVIVADHNPRVYGDAVVPVDMFHIPALILGEQILPTTYKGLTTQPDILATALDLLGLDLNHPIMGHSIYSKNKRDLAFMQFNQSYALWLNDHIAIVQPNQEPLTFTYKNERLVSSAHDAELEKNALAFIVTLDHLYNKRLYK